MSAAEAVTSPAYSAETLNLDADAEIARIGAFMRQSLRTDLRRRGFVVGVSGGIDSAVSAALAAKAVGAERVFCIFMPENDSDPESLALGRELTAAIGVEAVVEDIGPTLEAMNCYRRRDDLIRTLVPEYGEGWRCKVAISNALDGGYAITWLIVQNPQGEQSRVRMTPDVYLGLVAATNMKQRTRKQMEYFHADRLNYAVIGTPNRVEYDQGFFVKNGDGAADIKPIAHLYKSQVFQLAAHLGVPEGICRRAPTTDTWSLAQGQDEFYYSLPWAQMDLCLYGLDNGIAAADVARAANLTEQDVERAWADIAGKRRATRYLHLQPQLIG